MKPMLANHIDLAIGYNFNFAATNSQIIYCFLAAFTQHILEVRYQDFTPYKLQCFLDCFL